MYYIIQGEIVCKIFREPKDEPWCSLALKLAEKEKIANTTERKLVGQDEILIGRMTGKLNRNSLNTSEGVIS